jgi:hypothetical protein
LTQPVNILIPTVLAASNRIIVKSRRFFLPMQHNAIAIIDPGKNVPPTCCKDAVDVVVVTVNIVDAVELDGVMVCGVKLHVAPVGNPRHPNDTAASNPF